MAESKRYYWLKLQNDFFESKEMKKLRKIAGGDTYTIIYLKMQLASLKNNGVLFYEGVEDNFADEVALDIDEEPENVSVTIAFLQKYGLLTESTENVFSLSGAQKNTGSETASAARARRYRDNQKTLQCNATVTEPSRTCNATVTEPSRRDRERDRDREEIDKEKKIKLDTDAKLDTGHASFSSLSPILEEIKTKWETTFHPLMKSGELEMLDAYVQDYGRMGVLSAIETAGKNKSVNRAMLSPRYLLPILQNPRARPEEPRRNVIPMITDRNEKEYWARLRREDEARQAEAKRLGEDDPYGVYGEPS